MHRCSIIIGRGRRAQEGSRVGSWAGWVVDQHCINIARLGSNKKSEATRTLLKSLKGRSQPCLKWFLGSEQHPVLGMTSVPNLTEFNRHFS